MAKEYVTTINGFDVYEGDTVEFETFDMMKLDRETMTNGVKEIEKHVVTWNQDQLRWNAPWLRYSTGLQIYLDTFKVVSNPN